MNAVHGSNVCIIGAGPYGLSVAAHLRHVGIRARVFGVPMRRWLYQMPRRNFLRSEGCASSLSDPDNHFSLERYCKDAGKPYPDYGVPVPRDVFVNYGLYFQRALVPDVEPVAVEHLQRAQDGYELVLSSGECARAERVVVATGMDYMSVIPPQLLVLPDDLYSHSSDHMDFGRFRSCEVAVIGGGRSALETTAELYEAGARVRMLVRKPTLVWNPPVSRQRRPPYQRLRYPRTPLGDGLSGWFFSYAPKVFHTLPMELRIRLVCGQHCPSGAWWLKQRVEGRLPVLLGHRLRSAKPQGGRVILDISDLEGRVRQVAVDHVIAATGFRFNLDNLPFVSSDLKCQLRREGFFPNLSTHFESSAPGLYFAGFASLYAFGPLMRFVAGSHFAAQAICRHVARGQGIQMLSYSNNLSCPEFSA